ncbi:MAG: hypothetical protein WA991_07185 [Ornithinimicrobium sp.]
MELRPQLRAHLWDPPGVSICFVRPQLEAQPGDLAAAPRSTAGVGFNFMLNRGIWPQLRAQPGDLAASPRSTGGYGRNSALNGGIWAQLHAQPGRKET